MGWMAGWIGVFMLLDAFDAKTFHSREWAEIIVGLVLVLICVAIEYFGEED